MRKQTTKIMMISLIALTSMFGAVGCSKDKKNNASIYNGYGYGGYGYGNGGNAFRALGNEPSGRVQLGLEFGIVGGNGQTMQVQAGGELTIAQGLSCNSGYGSGLSGGVWSVRTIQPGYLSAEGALQQLILEAQGPNGVARLSISNGMIFSLTPKTISCSGAPGFDELAALVRIDSINGAPCNASFSVYLVGSSNMCGGY